MASSTFAVVWGAAAPPVYGGEADRPGGRGAGSPLMTIGLKSCSKQRAASDLRALADHPPAFWAKSENLWRNSLQSLSFEGLTAPL